MDIAKILPTIIDKIKIILWPVFLVCIALVFMPSNWLQFLGLNGFSEDYKGWISGGFIISTAFILVDLFHLIKKMILNSFYSKRIRKNMINDLKELSESQKLIIQYLFDSNNPPAMNLNITNPEVSYLEAKRIIMKVGKIGHFNSFPYSLTTIAKEILKKDEKLTEEIFEVKEEEIDEDIMGW